MDDRSTRAQYVPPNIITCSTTMSRSTTRFRCPRAVSGCFLCHTPAFCSKYIQTPQVVPPNRISLTIDSISNLQRHTRHFPPFVNIVMKLASSELFYSVISYFLCIDGKAWGIVKTEDEDIMVTTASTLYVRRYECTRRSTVIDRSAEQWGYMRLLKYHY
jgi:hypothetical protein